MLSASKTTIKTLPLAPRYTPPFKIPSDFTALPLSVQATNLFTPESYQAFKERAEQIINSNELITQGRRSFKLRPSHHLDPDMLEYLPAYVYAANGLKSSVYFSTGKDCTPALNGTVFLSIEKCGEGGFGRAKKVITLHTGEICLLKLSTELEDPKFEDQRERSILKTLKRFIGSFSLVHQSDERKSVLALPYVDGMSLDDFSIKPQRTVNSPSRESIFQYILTMTIAQKIIQATEMLHTTSKLLHCDIKPANMILGPSSAVQAIKNGSHDLSGLCVELIDFGNALDLGETCRVALSTFKIPEIQNALNTPTARKRPNLPYSIKSDIYCVGKTIEYILNKNTDYFLRTSLKKRGGPTCTCSYDQDIHQVLKGFLEKEPSARCTLEEANQRIENLLKQLYTALEAATDFARQDFDENPLLPWPEYLPLQRASVTSPPTSLGNSPSTSQLLEFFP